MLLFYGPVAVALFCFGSWTIAGRELTPAKAYTALALFSLLRFPMSFLPMVRDSGRDGPGRGRGRGGGTAWVGQSR